MNKRMLLLFGILLVIANACGVSGTEVQTNKTPGLAATEVTASEIAPPQSTTPMIPTKEGLYENDVFSFTIPEGWGLTLSQGEHFDLGVEKFITIHNKSLSKKSVAFFTIASAALSDGKTLESIFAQAYQKGPEIEDALIKPFEKDSMTGIELTYGRPWGEPRYKFHDIWLENGGVVFLLSFQAYPDSFEPHSQTFAAILDSFSFKQSQTQVTEMPETGATELPEAITTAFPLPPSTARIAFAAKGWTVPNSGEEIFVMNTDGSGITALSNSLGDDRDPAWSPDGKYLAFTSDRDGNTEVYIMNADGTNVRSLMAGALHYPERSPDGTQIAFDGEPGGCLFEVYIMQADGSGMRKITNHPGGCGEYNKSPSWSPDGKQLVYSSTHRNPDPGTDIYIIDVDGSGETALTHGKTDLHNGGFYPSWSPIP